MAFFLFFFLFGSTHARNWQCSKMTAVFYVNLLYKCCDQDFFSWNGNNIENQILMIRKREQIIDKGSFLLKFTISNRVLCKHLNSTQNEISIAHKN